MTALSRALGRSTRQVSDRQARGDRADVPRPVLHEVSMLPWQLRSAAVELEAAGFAVRQTGRRGLALRLELQRTDALDPQTARQFTIDVVGLLNKHGGRYRGWSAWLVEAQQRRSTGS